MKLCVVSHSLIARRQRLFFEHVRNLGVDVLQVGPNVWGTLSNSAGFPVVKPGDNYHFLFDDRSVFPAVEQFAPDVIYCQEELTSGCARQCDDWAHRLGCKLAYFVWENQMIGQDSKELGAKADLVIAGNSEAAELHGTETVLPQVGVDPKLFFTANIKRNADFLFATGKHTREKGWDLFARLGGGAVKIWSDGGVPYEKMPELYQRAKTVVTPSRDTPQWKEQAGNYVNVEGLMCGCSVVASDSAAMVEWLSGCPGVCFFARDDYNALEKLVHAQLGRWKVNLEGRDWALARFGTDAVSKRLLEAFEKI